MKAKRAKTVTVDQKCLIVSSDGYPVGTDGEEFSKGHPIYEWEKRRVSVNRFCPRDLRVKRRRTVQYHGGDVLKCNCHGKWRLI